MVSAQLTKIIAATIGHIEGKIKERDRESRWAAVEDISTQKAIRSNQDYLK